MSEPSVEALITAADEGNHQARDQLFATLYEHLHSLARRQLAPRAGNLTIGPSTLVHETYLKLAKGIEREFPDRARFMAYAAQAMRGLVIDYARRRQAQKRGGNFEITQLPTEPQEPEQVVDADQLQRIHHALEELARIDRPLAELVDLKYFAGFSFGEIAALRQVSERTVMRHWEKARMYLFRAVRAEDTL